MKRPGLIPLAAVLLGLCAVLAVIGTLIGPEEQEAARAEPTPTPTLFPPTPTSTATLDPTETPVAVATSTPEILTEEAWLAIYEAVLAQNEIQVTSAEIADGRAQGGERILIVSYISTIETAIELFSEIGFFLGPTDREDIDLDSLLLVVGDQQGNAIGLIGIAVDDYIAWKAGSIDDAEFFSRWAVEGL